MAQEQSAGKMGTEPLSLSARRCNSSLFLDGGTLLAVSQLDTGSTLLAVSRLDTEDC